ncbi:MAG: sodium:glutamate symporter [Desulfobacteraceae bacterium]|jgi:ESS family glutamate:Na+ symporter|nr:MAG: sodium:glutamate symporter [Desulfobacteraceae bacterium]
METGWEFLIDMCVIGGLLLLATFIRTRVRFFQKYMVPNNIVAGFLLLFIGNEFLGLVHVSSDRYGSYVYHLLAIMFIAMALRKGDGVSSRPMVATGIILTIGYGLQAFIGMLITYVAILFFKPDLFPTFGHFLVLGFGQGPGQAFALGKSWEGLGFENAGNIGLTFAAIGYLWACTFGVWLVYWNEKRDKGEKQNISEEERLGIVRDMSRQAEAGRLVTATSAIDGFTFQIALVGLVYLTTYGLLTGIEALLTIVVHKEAAFLQLKNTMWGLHFIFATVMAILFRKLILQFQWSHILDNGLLTRISGSSLDFMVTAAIGAISISIFRQYLTLILITTTVGGIATILFLILIFKHSAIPHVNERIASIYGTLTGTLSTGLTLTRIVDPQFKTQVAQDLVFGCGIAFPMAVPVILSVMIPLAGMTSPNPGYYYLGTILFLGFYTLGLYVALYFVSKGFHPGKSRA